MHDALLFVGWAVFVALVVWAERRTDRRLNAAFKALKHWEPVRTEPARPIRWPIDANPWIPVTERLPRLDLPTLVWGDKLNSDDFPVNARLCGCHEKWISERYFFDDETEENLVEQLRDLVGNVTHWLDWSPPSGTEE